MLASFLYESKVSKFSTFSNQLYNKRIEKKQLYENAEIVSKINLGNGIEVDKAINVI